MSAPIILLTLLGVAVAGFGVHLVSLHLHRLPLEIRRPGPLFRPRRSRPPKAHSSELRRLVSVVSNAILNDRSALAELQDVFHQLEADTDTGTDTDAGTDTEGAAALDTDPNTHPTGPDGQTSGSRRDRSRRSHQIEHSVTALEARWSKHYGSTVTKND